MKDRPILFQGAMVRATNDDSKTQTRREVKDFVRSLLVPEGFTPEFVAMPENENCPYGYPGDRLYVRETFFAFGRWETRYSAKKCRDEWHFIDMTIECDRAYQYAADSPDVPLAKGRGPMPGWWKRPAIHMPRVASRTLLEIVAVRVEPLNYCSEDDAKAEGIKCRTVRPRDTRMDGQLVYGLGTDDDWCGSAKEAYGELWESINGAGSWSANPWVWVVEFKRIDQKAIGAPS